MLYAFYFMSFVCDSYVILCHTFVIHISSICDSYVLICHLYVTRMCLHLIRMSLVWTHIASACTWIPFLCHLYVHVFHLYVTSMCSCVIPMSLLSTRMLSVRHSYVLVSHLYVARMWLYYALNRTSVFLQTMLISSLNETFCENIIKYFEE